jgi:DisA bacterial checkpoint controller nucleotide-binding
MAERASGRLRRLSEELEEHGLRMHERRSSEMLLEEIDRALRPPVHERRVVSSGTILDPATDPSTWEAEAELEIGRRQLDHQPLRAARRFTDGLSSWLLRSAGGGTEWLVFDRPAGSERDLVVLAGVLGATIVQRHPTGSVRVVGDFGVLRWNGLDWHLEPPVARWLEVITPSDSHGNPKVLQAVLEFAVHDLGSRGIGSLLVYRTGADEGPVVEERLPTPLPLRIRKAAHLAPLRHALAQIDGAAIFDTEGELRKLGVRLIPSKAAETTVEPLGGTRHTSGRRYSYDDPLATVVAVSEDGPVTVLRNGDVLGQPIARLAANPARSFGEHD